MNLKQRHPFGYRTPKYFQLAGRRGLCQSLLLVSLIPLAISGCAAKRMNADFISFEKAYAETSNREELLNLARLQNHDPTYFFKLGQITSAYKMQASLTATGNKVTQGTLAGANVIGGGTPGLIYENDPSFTFIPVNDDTSAQLLLKPVPAETFYNLYLQGWRVDQLFRLMVDRIELSTPTADGKGCSVETIRNVPPPVYSKSDAAMDADYLRDASNYVTFLRISALAYGLQKHGHLLLRGTIQFVPYDKNSVLAGENNQNGPKATDLAAAAAKSESWEYDGKQWILGRQIFTAMFYLNPRPGETQPDPNLQTIKSNILNDSRMKGLENGPALDNSLSVLANGFSIEGAPTDDADGNDSCKSVKGVSAHLVVRSLIGLMAAVAQEETPYDALAQRNPAIPTTRANDQQMNFAQAVPRIEQVPALRLKWIAQDKGTQPVIDVSYKGKYYLITDTGNPETPENQYWNRDMFRLINQLTAQVTVDISKFPLPGILRVD